MGTRERKRSRSLTNDNHLYEMMRMSQPDRPIHQHRDSLFSSSSGFVNFRGFFNLALILLFLSTVRVALENIIKYGILIDYVQMASLLAGSSRASVVSLTVLHLLVLFSYIIEMNLSKKSSKPGDGKALCLIAANLSAVFLWPILSSHLFGVSAVAASACCFFYLTILLKLCSYHTVNYWCRQHRKSQLKRRNSQTTEPQQLAGYQELLSNGDTKQKKDLVQYPANLSIRDVYYFMYAPTLCYELNFPRTDRIRKRFLIKRLFEMIFLTQLNLALIQQWIVPTIRNSLKPLQDMDYFRMLERLLKLSIPNHLIWLIWFYVFFHSTLNVVGELMRFSDRQFYRDWWNAESIMFFWKNWNIPVHHWCVRHMYVPLLKRGYSRSMVTVLVFLLSAVLHEYLVSVPLRVYNGWAFTGMALQIPFMFLVNRDFIEGIYANIFVWISLIIGQPLCILACYHDYYVINQLKPN